MKRLALIMVVLAIASVFGAACGSPTEQDPGASAAAQWNGLVAGLLILALSLPRGHIRERYGAWQSWIV